MKIQDNPLFDIFHIAKSLERLLDKNAIESCGVTSADAKLLMMIEHSSEAKQSKLAEALRISAPAVSRHIDKLIKQKYVAREVNPTNRRSSKISLTEEGKAVQQEVKKYFEETLESLMKELGGISKETATELHAISQKIKEDILPDYCEMKETLEQK